MSKKNKIQDGVIVPEELDHKVQPFGDEEPPEENDGGIDRPDEENDVTSEDPEEKLPEEGNSEDGEQNTEPETEEPSEDEELNPEDSGCRAFGDTLLTFPALPEKPLVDYRAEVVLNCFRNQPSVMELNEGESEEVSE